MSKHVLCAVINYFELQGFADCEIEDSARCVLCAVINCFDLQGFADCKTEDSARCSTLFVLIALMRSRTGHDRQCGQELDVMGNGSWCERGLYHPEDWRWSKEWRRLRCVFVGYI